jgi:cytochrome c55X
MKAARFAPIAIAATLVLAPGCAGADASRDAVPSAAPSAPAPSRQREIVRLLRQDCGSCHGMRLTGGLGPPLTAQALRDKPPASLTATIVGGRPGTAMPPWRPFLSDAEAAWLVARLQQGDADAR